MDQTSPKKGPNLLLIIGAGCLVMAMVGVCGVVGGAVYLGRRVQQAAQPFKDNPRRATMEWIIKANPDLELVSSDDKSITVKEKKSGKVSTFTYDDIENNRMTFTTDEGETQVAVEGDGDNGSMTISNAEGETKIGAAAEGLPAWVPAYPDATEGKATFSSTQGEQVYGAYEFKTTSSAEAVLAHYKAALEPQGFMSTTTMIPGEGDGPRATGSYADTAGKRFLSVTVSVQSGETIVALSYGVTP